MPRTFMYPEGATRMNVFIPSPLKDALRQVAQEQGQSVSQIVTAVLKAWLQAQGKLPMRGGVE